MKKFLAVVAVCALGLLTSLVTGQEQQSLPPGVSAADWIPIGDKIGFAVTRESAAVNPEVLVGHFFAWHENTWKKIDSEGGFRVQPLTN